MKKYKIKVLVWLLSLSFLNIHAQQGFMKSYVFGNFHGGGVIYNDDAYMIIGGTGFGNCPDNSATCMDVLQTDLDGNLNWQQRFNYPNEQFFPELNGIKILNDSTYIIAGNSTYLETSWQNFFLQINHNGDSLQLIEYGNEFRDKGGSLGIIDKKLFAFSYEQEIDIGSHLKLLKTNTNFAQNRAAINT